MTPDEYTTFQFYRSMLSDLATVGWDRAPSSSKRLQDHARTHHSLYGGAGNIPLPLEAHLLWWSMTNGLSVSEFELLAAKDFSHCVEMITDSLYWLCHETASGAKFLESNTAKEGWDERLKVVSASFAMRTGNNLGEFDTQTPNLPQIGPANTVKASGGPGPVYVPLPTMYHSAVGGPIIVS